MEDSPITDVVMPIEPIEDIPVKRRRSPVVWIVLAVVLLALMGGAAFVGGRLITGTGLMGIPGLGMLMGPGGPAGATGFSMEMQMTPAPELPTRQADANGLYQSRDGNSIFIQQLPEDMGGVSVGPGGEMPKGPTVEVVVTSDTKIYADVTDPPSPDQLNAGKAVIQQKVELVPNGDEIGSDYMLSVWGEKRGDRLIAEVIYYSRPMIIRSGPGGDIMPPPDGSAP